MPDFFYIDMYFDPEETGLGDVVGSAIAALREAGCRFNRTTFMEQAETGLPPFFPPGAKLTPENLKEQALAYIEDRRRRGLRFVSFPPWGRVIFEYDFRFAEEVLEDLHMEEEDSRSSANELGLSFLYSDNPGTGRKIKATLNVWEEFVLTGGGDAAVANMMSLMRMVEGICRRARPFFGAMNNEIHLNTDRSLERLMRGELPSGNEYVLVGEKLMGRLNTEKLAAEGLRWKALPGCGALLQFRDRFAKGGGTSVL